MTRVLLRFLQHRASRESFQDEAACLVFSTYCEGEQFGKVFLHPYPGKGVCRGWAYSPARKDAIVCLGERETWIPPRGKRLLRGKACSVANKLGAARSHEKQQLQSRG